MITQESFNFLHELKNNNNRDWFQSQKKRYDSYKKNYLDTASSLLSRMKEVDASLAELQAKECTFRIHRDIRFSKDKTPYKTHVSFGFAPGGKKLAMASYYLHLEEGSSFVGGGLYMPPADVLKIVRSEIDVYADEFLELVNHAEFTKHFYSSLDRDLILSRPPKGFNPEHKAIEYLKLKSFTAVKSFEMKKALETDFEDWVIEAFIAVKPLITFINQGIWAHREEAEQ